MVYNIQLKFIDDSIKDFNFNFNKRSFFDTLTDQIFS